jgi:FdhE protein
MASLLRKWLHGRPPPSRQVADALAELAKFTQPALAPSREILRAVLPEIFLEPIRESTPTFDATSVHEKLASGVPLLRGTSVILEMESMRQRWLAVCAAVERQNNDARAVAAAFTALDPSALLAEVLASRPDAVHAQAELFQLDPALTATIFRLALFPVLAHMAAELAPLRRQSPWDHGNCPTCGSWPLLGEFRGLDQIRFLRCGLCASDWEFPRLCCPFCGQRDHRQLGFFHVEGEENHYRAATCDECRGYVKMISTLTPLYESQLLVADLATLHLDLAAADRGYHVP